MGPIRTCTKKILIKSGYPDLAWKISENPDLKKWTDIANPSHSMQRRARWWMSRLFFHTSDVELRTGLLLSLESMQRHLRSPQRSRRTVPRWRPATAKLRWPIMVQTLWTCIKSVTPGWPEMLTTWSRGKRNTEFGEVVGGKAIKTLSSQHQSLEHNSIARFDEGFVLLTLQRAVSTFCSGIVYKLCLLHELMILICWSQNDMTDVIGYRLLKIEETDQKSYRLYNAFRTTAVKLQ